MAINFSQYTNPFIQRTDLNTDPIFKYAQYNLEQKRLAEQVAHQNRVASDINTRFAIEQGDKATNREFELAQQNKAKTDKLLMAARTAVSQGNWNVADSLIGPLAELGVKVDRQQDAQGRPIYRFQAPDFAAPAGETYESAAGKLNIPGVSSPPVQPNQSSPDTTRQDQLEQPQATPQPSPTRSDVIEQTAPDASGDIQSDAQPVEQQQSPFDPFKLDSGEFARINSMRLDPVLKGIESGFPNRFQPLVGSYLESLKSLNMSPEATLDQGQKPLDTMARLYGAQLNSEANMARASLGAQSGESSDARIREQQARTFGQQTMKNIGVQDALDNQLEFEEIRRKLNSTNNPNANADGIKQLLAMREGGRITDKDFDIAAVGYASGWDQVTTALQRTIVTGLTDLQRLRFNQMLDTAQKGFDKRIRTGMQKLKNLKQSYRYEPERYGIETYIRANIPEQYWDEETRNFSPEEYQGGMPSRTQVKSGVRATVAAPEEDIDATIRSLLGEE